MTLFCEQMRLEAELRWVQDHAADRAADKGAATGNAGVAAAGEAGAAKAAAAEGIKGIGGESSERGEQRGEHGRCREHGAARGGRLRIGDLSRLFWLWPRFGAHRTHQIGFVACCLPAALARV